MPFLDAPFRPRTCGLTCLGSLVPTFVFSGACPAPPWAGFLPPLTSLLYNTPFRTTYSPSAGGRTRWRQSERFRPASFRASSTPARTQVLASFQILSCQICVRRLRSAASACYIAPTSSASCRTSSEKSQMPIWTCRGCRHRPQPRPPKPSFHLKAKSRNNTAPPACPRVPAHLCYRGNP